MSAVNERGQVAILVLGFALVAFAVAGVAVDGTRAFLMRRTFQNAADSSALAAAAELDESAYYSTGGRVVQLDPESARRVAASWLGRRGLSVRAAIDADEQGISVILRGGVQTTFLGLIGIRTVPVAVQARAEPVPDPAASLP